VFDFLDVTKYGQTACNITGKHAVSCLIDGLSDRTLRNGAKAGRYETPEELYTEYLSTLVTEVADNETKVADRRGKGFYRRGWEPK
jgi:hypothetical protein